MLNFDVYTSMVRQAALAGALAGFFGAAPPAMAAMAPAQSAALDHAQTIEAAWQRLEDHIRLRSAAPTAWPGATPPATTGWQTDWTERGIGALYCGQVLVVFATRADLKGVGDDQRAVRLAPHIEAARTHDEVPPLHWLEAGEAEGILGRASVALPACMAAAAPTGRVALAGEVIDPLTVSNQVLTPERQNRPCPAATHGAGQAWVRDLVQEVNGRGADVGNPVPGPWRLLVDHCVADYTEWVHFRQSCTFAPGPPHSGTLTGETVWRRQRAVTAAGETWMTAPQFVSSSCWTDPNPVPPTPREWTTTTAETRTAGCPEGHTGSRTQRRTLTWRHLQWPWDASATVTRASMTNWATTGSSCRRIETDGDGGGRSGGGGSWDVDGDGVGDYDTYGSIPDRQKASAKAVDRDAVPGGKDRTGGGGGGDGGKGDRGEGDGPGGQKGSGDRGR